MLKSIRTWLGIAPAPAVDWRAKYEAAHKRELRAMRLHDVARALTQEETRKSAVAMARLAKAQDAFRWIAEQETPGANATVKRMAYRAKAELPQAETEGA